MSEFLTIQVGQCGNQIGSSFWPSILEEYGIQKPNSTAQRNNLQYPAPKIELQSSFNSFFVTQTSKSSNLINSYSDLQQSRIRARCILVDMEDSVLARYKTGPLRDIFDDKCFVSSYPGSGNNWAEGYCYHGPRNRSKLLNTIRRSVEKCDSLHGFLLLFSVGGGTGSGLGSYILQLLNDNFPDIERFVSCVYPTGTEDVITCPYNMALSTKLLSEHASCVFPVENRALMEMVSRQFNDKNRTDSSIVEFQPFQDMNNIIVDMLLHLTSGSRFAGNLNVDINEISTNMVPFPNMQFLSSSFSPLVTPTVPTFQTINSRIKDEIFRSACSRNNQLLKIDPLGPKSVVLGVTLIGRGDFVVSDLRSYVERLQSKGRFTHWSRKSVKVGLCNVPPAGQNAAMLSLFNTSSMSSLFIYISELFKKIYKKKAHVHHYTQIGGFESQFFEDCINNLTTNADSYKQFAHAKCLNSSRPVTR